MSIRSLLSLATLLGASVVAARDQYILQPTTAALSATTLAGAHGYTYIGCWNETVGYRNGVRALAGGKELVDNFMTTSICLEYCAAGKNGKSLQYAGTQNGRECWCAANLSLFSEKLNDSSRCISSCSGNDSEICGGQLALTLYNLTAMESKTGIAWSQFSGVAGYGTLAVVTLIISAIL